MDMELLGRANEIQKRLIQLEDMHKCLKDEKQGGFFNQLFY